MCVCVQVYMDVHVCRYSVYMCRVLCNFITCRALYVFHCSQKTELSHQPQKPASCCPVITVSNSCSSFLSLLYPVSEPWLVFIISSPFQKTHIFIRLRTFMHSCVIGLKQQYVILGTVSFSVTSESLSVGLWSVVKFSQLLSIITCTTVQTLRYDVRIFSSFWLL